MRKIVGRLLVGMSVLALSGLWMLALSAEAVSVHPLGVEQMARWGATHAIRFRHTDLTTASTNTMQTFTNVFSVNSNQYVKLVGMKLVRPFSYSESNAFNSVKVQAGDGSSTNRYLSFTEVNQYGAYKEFVPGTAPSLTLVAVSNNGTNMVTNVTYNAGAEYTYTASDTVNFMFLPGASATYKLDDLDAGEVEFYFKVLDKF